VVLGSPEGEPKVFVWAVMPLRSFPIGGSCPDTAACPSSCRPRDATWQPPASTPISHPEMLPPLAFFAAPLAAAVPRAEIDRALLGGDAPRQVAVRYGLSATGLQRHQKHIAPSLIKAREAVEVGKASSVLNFVQQLVAKAHQFTDAAEKKGDLRTAMSGLRELTRMAELLAKLTGEIDQHNETNVVNVHITPEAASRIAQTYLARRRQPEKLTEVIDVSANA